MTTVARTIEVMERVAPSHLALSGDNIGLQAPGPSAVRRILLSLDVDTRVVNEAKRRRADLIIAHHPVIYRSLNGITDTDLAGKVLIAAIQNEIGIFIAHTNLDCASGGVNDILAQRLELHNVRPLQKAQAERKYKLVTFVPETHADKVRAAICEAGGGHIGEYSYCTFETPGTGTFMPSDEASPFIGAIGKMNKEAELRLEALVPSSSLAASIAAMKAAHPYEEVAYDVYELVAADAPTGLGRVGELPASVHFKDYVDLIKRRLGVKKARAVGREKARIKRVAVCGGSGGDLLPEVVAEGAEVFVTGEMKYHQMLSADASGLCVVEAGHCATEQIVLPALAEKLKRKLSDVDIIISRVRTDRSEWI